ncbi:MAG: sigma-54-dependent Fis family transcriptional regulator [Myxococcales bacterium]|nr:sigma-54-dependent Fis family transcriptional regulator [Myxococcales bacterium]
MHRQRNETSRSATKRAISSVGSALSAVEGDAVPWILVPTAHSWRRHSLGDPVIVGSGPSADVQLPRLASQQGRFEWLGGQVRVRDLTGAGLVLGGKRVGATARVDVGTVLRLAGVPILILRGEGSDGGRPWLQAGQMRSSCPNLWQAFAELAIAGESEAPLLIRGETGAGKELASRLAHDVSPRADRPFVALNCAALPPGLLEAELFGSRRGAYTGSVDNREGAFSRASGGTLFLDEVGELSPPAQAALLRVLETGEVQVVGGDMRRVDVRVVAATHRDLAKAVRAGRFRLDLLHRLAVAEVTLPPLRSRTADLVPLLEGFIGTHLPSGAGEVLRQHRWPGNVRELKNVGRRINMRTGGAPPSLSDLCRAIGKPARGPALPQRRELVADLLQSCSTVAAAHRASGLPRSTFFRYVKQLRSESAHVSAA